MPADAKCQSKEKVASSQIPLLEWTLTKNSKRYIKMIRYQKLRFIKILVLGALIGVLGCSNRENHQKRVVSSDTFTDSLLKTTTKLISKKEVEFKIWLQDTLTVLGSKSTQNKANGQVDNKITVESDSLSLSIDLYYDFLIYTRPNKQENENVLSLLKEYKEYPKKGSIVS